MIDSFSCTPFDKLRDTEQLATERIFQFAPYKHKKKQNKKNKKKKKKKKTYSYPSIEVTCGLLDYKLHYDDFDITCWYVEFS